MNLFFLLLLGLLALIPREGHPAEALTERQALADWLGKLDLRAGTRLDLSGDFHGVVYARGVSLGQRGFNWDPGAKPYLDFNLGGDFARGDKAQLLVLMMIHPVHTTDAVIRRLPFRDRVKLAALPDIEIGPALNLPAPGRVWTWRSALGLVVALGF